MSYEYWTRTTSGGATSMEPASGGGRPELAEPPRSRRNRSVPQLFAGVVGGVFLLVGVLGFVPGVVSMFGEFSLTGPDSHAKLLGLFEVSALHNVVHMLFGVGLLAARSAAWSVRYLLVGGVAYLGVFVYGLLVVGSTSAINFLPVNAADNVLHLGLGVAMVALGIVGAMALRRNPVPT